MSDLKRMEDFYARRDKRAWSIFGCYPFFLDCKQTYIMRKILENKTIDNSRLLDIGAGEGNFILKMISFGFFPENITAIEYLKDRVDVLRKKLLNIRVIHDDFLNVELDSSYDVITIMAVLTSIIDNEMRYKLFEKSLTYLSKGGVLVLYDYFDDNEIFLTQNYRAVSLQKIELIAKDYKIETHKRVYIKSKYAKGLCKLGLQSFIPLLESLKIFNDKYYFVVIKNEK